MKKSLLVLVVLFPCILFSQHLPDSLRHWHRGGAFALNFTQVSYTNWAAGGESSISGQALLGLHVNYKKDSTTAWDNSLDLAIGLMQQGRSFTRKTDDKIDFTSKASRYAFKRNWFYTALFGFKTQFAPGYTFQGDTARTLISDFMSPAYSIMSVGLEYRPNKHFSFFVSPVTGKTTFVMNQMLADAGAFGVDPAEYDTAGNKIKDGQNIRNELGGYIRVQYDAEIMKNVTIKSRLELFSNYLHNPQNIDVNAECLLSMKVNKYISASLNLQAIYDDDVNIEVDKDDDGDIDAIGPRFQFKQLLGVGFAVKF